MTYARGGLRSTDLPQLDFLYQYVISGMPWHKCVIFSRATTFYHVLWYIMSNSGDKFNSFKVSVSVVDTCKLMKSGMVYTCMCVRRWRELKTIIKQNYLNIDKKLLQLVIDNCT